MRNKRHPAVSTLMAMAALAGLGGGEEPKTIEPPELNDLKEFTVKVPEQSFAVGTTHNLRAAKGRSQRGPTRAKRPLVRRGRRKQWRKARKRRNRARD